MSAPETRILPPDGKGIDEAVRLIAAGEPVAVPTETVYGLAANAANGEAVARIYAAKGRPSFNPLIVHVLDQAAAARIALFNDRARELAERYWPGPLTLVLPLRRDRRVSGLVTAGLATIALRVPAHPLMRAILAASGLPLAAPSANASGSISPTRAEHVLASLGGRIAAVVDGGATEVGIESTIVAVDDDGLRLLRHGPIPAEELAASALSAGPIEAPGQLASHYAPSKPLRLDATEARPGEWLIGFGPIEGHISLSPGGNLVEAAARLFDLLHQADRQALPRIAIAPLPDSGLGIAINDRLRRAAAPR